MLGRILPNEIVNYVRAIPWKLEVPNLIYTFDELVEPTPYVGCYQSRNERPVIWAAALRQFYRW